MGKLERVEADVPVAVADELRAVVAEGRYGSTNEALREIATDWVSARALGPISAEELAASFEKAWQEPGTDIDEFVVELHAFIDGLSDPDAGA